MNYGVSALNMVEKSWELMSKIKSLDTSKLEPLINDQLSRSSSKEIREIL